MRYAIPVFSFAILLISTVLTQGCASKVVVGRSVRERERPAYVEPQTASGAAEDAGAVTETEPVPQQKEAAAQAPPEPAMSEPEQTKPTPTKPAPAEPAPAEPAPAEPAPAEPAPAEPAPAEPTDSAQEPVVLPPSPVEETVEAPVAVPRSSSKSRVEGLQESPYELDLSIGGEGLTEGFFDDPVAVAVDERENIYVLEQGNHRIQCFDQYGDIRFWWGEQGSGAAEYEVSVVDGVDTLRMTGAFEFNYPSGIIIDPDERWNLLNHRIQRFLVTKDDFDAFPDEVFVMLPKSGTTTFPDKRLRNRYERDGTRVILDPVYLNDGKADPFFPSQYVWGGLGYTEDNLNSPTDLVMGENNLLYVSDTENRRVQVFYVTPINPISDTEYYYQIGNDLNYPYGQGRLNNPTAVAYDNSNFGSVLVLDKDTEDNFIIQRFTRDGEFLGVLKITGAPATMLRYPVDMALNPFDNTIFITDKGHRSVMVYSNKGEFMFSIGGEELKDPRGVAVLRNGYVYVTDAATDKVYRYIPR